jgi:hypothetical protein
MVLSGRLCQTAFPPPRVLLPLQRVYAAASPIAAACAVRAFGFFLSFFGGSLIPVICARSFPALPAFSASGKLHAENLLDDMIQFWPRANASN